MRMSLSTVERPTHPDAEAIWAEFHEGLLGFVRRRVRSPEAAEDIVQEVMLRVHRQVGGINRAQAVGAWVHTIARNAITDHYRSANVRRELASGSEVVPEAAAEPAADTPDVRGELAACIAPLLKRLPQTYREAITLSEIDGLTQAEAAARLDLSLPGMKSRVQRGRQQLKQMLIQCCAVERDARGDLTSYRPRHGSCECGAD
jgi:RNA polymerase sigma-70 factor, ECF subfamily